MKRINIYTVATTSFLILIIAVGIYLVYTKNKPEGMRQYVNTEYGLSFEYPALYTLQESKLQNTAGTEITITDRAFTLTGPDKDLTAIRIDLFKDTGIQATKKRTLAQNWIASSTSSHFTLSDMKAPGPTRVADKLAWLYTWNGTYRGISVVTDNQNAIYMFTVTYDGEGDVEKRNVFTKLMESVHFSDEDSPAKPTARSSHATPHTNNHK